MKARHITFNFFVAAFALFLILGFFLSVFSNRFEPIVCARLWLIDRKIEGAVHLVRTLSWGKKGKRGTFGNILTIKCFFFVISYKLIKSFITGPCAALWSCCNRSH